MSPELFDFQSKEFTSSTESINSNSHFSMSRGKVTLKQNENSTSSRHISFIRFTNDKVIYQPNADSNDKDNQSFISIKPYDLESQYYELNLGDIIKIGKILLKVRDISIKGKLKLQHTKTFNKPTIRRSFKSKHSTCKICYGTEEEGQLIHPCKCSGGVKYIHLSCLHQWIQTRSIREIDGNSYCKVYSLSHSTCEICEELYPDFIFEDGQYFEILKIPYNTSFNYIILESIQKDAKDERYLYLLNFDNSNRISIGRSHEADLRLTDISVSRFHSSIIYKEKKGKFYFIDSDSKFGSLVLMQNRAKIALSAEYPLSIQIGCNLIDFVLQDKCCLCSCFIRMCSKTIKEKYMIYEIYGKQNKKAIVIKNVFRVREIVDDYYEDEEGNGKLTDRFDEINSKKLIMKDVKEDEFEDTEKDFETNQYDTNKKIVLNDNKSKMKDKKDDKNSE